jgi:hypothetical protein
MEEKFLENTNLCYDCINIILSYRPSMEFYKIKYSEVIKNPKENFNILKNKLLDMYSYLDYDFYMYFTSFLKSDYYLKYLETWHQKYFTKHNNYKLNIRERILYKVFKDFYN